MPLKVWAWTLVNKVEKFPPPGGKQFTLGKKYPLNLILLTSSFGQFLIFLYQDLVLPVSSHSKSDIGGEKKIENIELFFLLFNLAA